MNIEQARQIAAQCWCDSDTSHIPMCSKLAEAFAERLVKYAAPTGWVKITPDRKPTAEDADELERVLVRMTDFKSWGLFVWNELPKSATHFLPIPKFVPDAVPPFGEWLMNRDDYAEYTNGNKGFRIEWLTKCNAEYSALAAKEGR